MKKIANEMIIPPQGKRKHKIIFKATFSDGKNNDELEKSIAMNLWKMWMFG